MLTITRSDENVSAQFDPERAAVATVEVGETIVVETAHHLALYKRELSEDDLLDSLPFDQLNPLTGPIEVAGAEPGDTVVVRIDGIEIGDHGDAPLIRNGGLLQGHLQAPYMRILRIEDGKVLLRDGISFPVRPNIGAIGTTPTSPVHTVHPGDHGGNLDDQNIGAGATLHLPVLVPGAMLCLGDVHASQGDTEWVAPVEVNAEVTLTVVDLVKDTGLSHVWTETATHWIVYGTAAELYDAIEQAALRLARFVSAGLGITLEDAAVLLSNVGELRLCQACKGPFDVVVRAEFPKAVDSRDDLRPLLAGRAAATSG